MHTISGRLERIIDAYVHAFQRVDGLEMHGVVQLRVHLQHKFAEKWLIRFFSPLCIKVKIIIDRVPEGLHDFINTPSLKSDNIFFVKNFAMKQSRFIIKFNMPGITFIVQHGSTIQPF